MEEGGVADEFNIVYLIPTWVNNYTHYKAWDEIS